MGADDSHGRRYILAIAFFLFVSIFVGGIFLVLYMIQPDSPSSTWYPIVGITLVCLPWVFWFVTCFYRFLSRKLGFRMVCWGEDVDPVDGIHEEGVGDSKTAHENDNLENQNTSTMNSTSDQSHTISSTKSSKQVHFGETVVVTEEEGNNASVKIAT